jgi:antitoxin HicB
MGRKKVNRQVGSDFEDFLLEEGTLESSTARAIKRVLAWQLLQAMKRGGVSQAELARRMQKT